MGPMLNVCKMLRCLNWVTKLNCLWGCGLDFSDRMETSSGPFWIINEPPSSFCSSTSFPSPPPLPSLLPQALQSVLNAGFQCNLSLFPTVSDNCLPIVYSHSIEIFFFLVPPSFTWSSYFPCSFHYICCCLFWHSLILHSFNIWPWGIFINLSSPLLRLLYPCWFIGTLYEGWNFNSGNYLFTTDTK